MKATQRLRRTLNEIEDITQQAKAMIEEVELDANDELVSVGPASKILGVSERQVRNIAADPSKPVNKYHSDGSLKRSSKKTNTYYLFSELHKYKKSQEG